VQAIRAINLTLTAVGAAVFAALLLYIVLAPTDFDQRTRDFAIAVVESRVQESLSDVARSETADRLTEIAGRLSERLEQRINALRDALDAGLDVFIADVLAAACELDCDRRDEARQAVRDFFEDSIARYGFALERIESLIVGEYEETMGELRADLSIFSGGNFLALAFAFGLAVFRGPAAAHLLPISLALTAATALAVTWYVLGQDWVMTIIFNDYWGWAYDVLLAVLALLMIDIAANRARVTSVVLNRVGNVFGGALSFVPC
jgi:hypothetical protein